MAAVGRVGSIPSLSVHSAILANSGAVLEQNEGIEELAGHWHLARRRMADIVLGGGFASSLTKSWIKRQSGEDLGANVRVVRAVAGIGRVDGATTERGGRRPSWARLKCVVHVAIGASNDNFEVVTPLAAVVCVVRSDWATPEDALDVRGGRRVVATIAGVLSWITLEDWTQLVPITQL